LVEHGLQLAKGAEIGGLHRNTIIAQTIEQRLDVVGRRFDNQYLQCLHGFHSRLVYLLGRYCA